MDCQLQNSDFKALDFHNLKILMLIKKQGFIDYFDF